MLVRAETLIHKVFKDVTDFAEARPLKTAKSVESMDTFSIRP